ncbi:MAG: translation initiation factor IF-3 [candidate division Zixibacteria bacterium]|nr:translation initiation factor IF-3 [candidate division Zixibacteria bacterium]
MRVNETIRISPIRLIGLEGEQVGIIPTNEAIQRARDAGLDLVEVAPTSRPPVCRILDYGKYKYEQSKKERISKKKQHSFQMKEMRYRPKIDEHDYQFKTKHVKEFLSSGSKVRAFVMFRGREMAYTEMGRKLLQRLVEDISEIADVESAPKMEGRTMSMVVSPNSQIMKELKKAHSGKSEDKRTEQTNLEKVEKTSSEE